MSFKFNWGSFPPEFYTEALEMLTRALNEGGNKPPNLVGPIIAKELDLGSQPPQLDILEISELEEDRFRAMFRMKYEGDGFLVLQTQVQANPLRLETSELPTMPSMGVVAAAAPLVVPMLLRISGLKLNGIVVLAVSKDDGITLVFRSDPLVSVEVHSTFDSVPSVRRMLQREIEATLRSLFQDDLPVIVHTMSVNEIRRAREAKEKRRREQIEKQQQRIRLQHARSDNMADAWTAREMGADGADSGTASVGSLPRSISQHLMASQLHQRLVELSRKSGPAGLDHGAEDPMQGMRTPSNDFHIYATPGVGAGASGMHGQWTPDMADPLQRSPPVLRASHRRSLSGGTGMYPDMLDRFLGDDWGRLPHPGEDSDPYNRHRAHEGLDELHQQQGGVVLRPSDNAVAARLASLMSMGHTLSPYTRRFTHTTMRADVNPRLGHYAPRLNTLVPPDADQLLSDGASAGSPPSAFSRPLQPDAAAGYGPRQASFSAGAASATPFSAITPPGGGVRSPFSRNRALRRKIHRVGRVSLSAGATDK
ncbi:ERMES complex subunit [Coemansia biformis]|uniref:Mitochondrial distribution and morphology protein 34 n=1 Tax=Coemansia biformis TaxID=1286918 RepID=A0A9W8CZK7_9FUNG|nr:ERMES complex subunit [Coemansia biformis]